MLSLLFATEHELLTIEILNAAQGHLRPSRHPISEQYKLTS